MLSLYKEIYLHIGKYVNDRTKISLLSVSKVINAFKFAFMFGDETRIEKIVGTIYYDNFSNVILNRNIIAKLPFNVERAHYTTDGRYIPEFVTHLTIICMLGQMLPIFNIPDSVTHLTFSKAVLFAGHIRGLIPSSVTHLAFGVCVNQSLTGVIPLSVTHLIIKTVGIGIKHDDIPLSVTHLLLCPVNKYQLQNYVPVSVTHLGIGYYNAPIDDSIPSVTHLTFDKMFNQPIKNCIPNTVTHLYFGWEFQQSVDDIPPSVIHLTLSTNYSRVISDDIRARTEIIFFDVQFDPTNKIDYDNFNRWCINHICD